VKAHAGTQVEDLGHGIGKLPGFSEVAVEVHLFVAFEGGGKEQAVNALGLAVGGIAGVEVGGIGFD
jgi:hypothetical protein